MLERGGDLGRLRLGGVPACGVQLRVGVLVALHGPVSHERVVAAHLGLGVAQASYDVIEASRREDPVAREHLEVARARVLREVADRAGRRDLAAGRQGLAGQDPRQCGLAGPVASDQPDAVTGRDAEGHVAHQQARTRTHLELGHSDHDTNFRGWGGATRRGAPRRGTRTTRSLVYEGTRGRKDTMRFNPKARIDQSQIETRSGGGGGGGMRLPMPGGGGGKIGLGTIVVIVLLVVLSQCTGMDLLGGSSGSQDSPSANTCQTGEDANKSQDCAVDLFTNSVQGFWKGAYPEQTGKAYDEVQTVRFQGGTQSGCGPASTEMGPFYCPTDQKVYLDTTFFDDMLQGQLGAQGGPFAIGYVIAHEYGHHIEDQLGILGQIRTQRGPKSDAVRVELMADCLAGAWAKGAQETTDAQGQQIISELTQDDIKRAIDAAQAVGDDRIQKRASGRVDTDSFTHGTAKQRVRWFNRGLEQGTIKGCDTFSTDDL